MGIFYHYQLVSRKPSTLFATQRKAYPRWISPKPSARVLVWVEPFRQRMWSHLYLAGPSYRRCHSSTVRVSLSGYFSRWWLKFPQQFFREWICKKWRLLDVFFRFLGKGLGSFEYYVWWEMFTPKDASWGWKLTCTVFRVQWFVSILKPKYNPIDIPVPVTSLRTICLSIRACSNTTKTWGSSFL